MNRLLNYPVLTVLLFVGGATAAPTVNGLRTAAVAMPDRYCAERDVQVFDFGVEASGRLRRPGLKSSKCYSTVSPIVWPVVWSGKAGWTARRKTAT